MDVLDHAAGVLWTESGVNGFGGNTIERRLHLDVSIVQLFNYEFMKQTAIFFLLCQPETISRISATCSDFANGIGFIPAHASSSVRFANTSIFTRPTPTSFKLLGSPNDNIQQIS
jgi:hypothetical protein